MYSGDNKYINHLIFRNFSPSGLTKAEVLGLADLAGKTFFLAQHSFLMPIAPSNMRELHSFSGHVSFFHRVLFKTYNHKTHELLSFNNWDFLP